MSREKDFEERRRAERAQTLTLPTIAVRRHGELVPPVEGDELVTAAIGPLGQMVALWAPPAVRDALQARTTGAGGAIFPDTRSAQPVSARVVQYWPEPRQVTALAEVSAAFPFVQPLPDGQVLLVGARCRNRAEGPEHNAAVYDQAGALTSTGVLGDGIEHLRTTSRGDIWVGYFDEGVFGNYGWTEPIGAAGLIRFTADLSQAWRYSPPEGSNHIADCYALNVTDTDVWSSYYTGFPIVRISEDQTVAWQSGTTAHAIIAQDDHVALAAGYAPDRDRIQVGTLQDDRLHIERQLRLVLPDGNDLPNRTRFFGHGPDLHVLTGTTWYQLSLNNL